MAEKIGDRVQEQLEDRPRPGRAPKREARGQRHGGSCALAADRDTRRVTAQLGDVGQNPPGGHDDVVMGGRESRLRGEPVADETTMQPARLLSARPRSSKVTYAASSVSVGRPEWLHQPTVAELLLASLK